MKKTSLLKRPSGKSRRKNGEGSVYQRASDGRWTAAVSVLGTRKWFHGATAEEVVDKLTQAREQQRKHLPFANEKLTVGQWLDVWLENCRPPQTKPKTWINYELFTRLHLKPQLGHVRLVKLEPQHVRDFLHSRLDAGYSTKTVKHLRDALRASLNSAVNDGKLYRNVAKLVEPPEIEARPLDVYNPQEARQLIAAAEGHRLGPLITTATAIGLRAGECLGLQWSDVNFERGTLMVAHNLQRVKRVRRGDVVQEGEAKSERLLSVPKGKKIKPLRMPEVVVAALRRHRVKQDELRSLAGPAWKGDGNYVFTSSVGTPLEARRLGIEFKQIVASAGMRPIRFHDLRHSCAALLIAQGVHPKAIQEVLRHSSIQVTMDVYGHLFDEMQKDTAAKMDVALTPIPAQTAGRTAVKPRLVRVK